MGTAPHTTTTTTTTTTITSLWCAPKQQVWRLREGPRCRGHWRGPQSRAAVARKHGKKRAQRWGLNSVREDQDGSWSGLDPQLESAVPSDQRPVNELAHLRKAWLYSWGVLDTGDYVKKLGAVFVSFLVLLGGPVAYQTFDPHTQLAQFILSSSVGALLVVLVIVIRIYLGWAYVEERLLSAALPYEETGWYDGQVFVKPPEVLMRDRLIGTYQVRPVMQKLKTTLIGSAATLLTCSGLLFGSMASGTGLVIVDHTLVRTPRVRTSDGVVYSSKVLNLWDLRNNDELAAEEAAAQGGVPGYCGDRALRAFAGGQYCAKFDR